jgi:hypothetical protein
MLWLHFAGWFQCRLATDPDPCDEPRGVSGYAQALSGEPDLDRIIRLQPEGAVQRSYCPGIGVTVTQVVLEGERQSSHPLLGAAVDLIDDPKFEGRNGIVAEDGFEPIVPFVLEISLGDLVLRRAHADEESFPFADLQASGVQSGLGAVAEATGIYDLARIWKERYDALEADLKSSTDPTTQVALRRRLVMLSNTALTGFFGVRMFYAFALTGSATVSDPTRALSSVPNSGAPWPLDFWLGGWDADAFCGYMKGAVGLPTSGNLQQAEEVARLERPGAPRRG